MFPSLLTFPEPTAEYSFQATSGKSTVRRRGGGCGEAGGGGHAHLMAVFLATHDGYLGLGTQGSQGSAQAASVQAEGLSPLNLPPRSPQASAP